MIEIRLFHGRDDPEQGMTERGFEGPTITVEAVTVVYMTHWLVRFPTADEARDAMKLFGWLNWDSDDGWVEITTHEDMWAVYDREGEPRYYGDMDMNVKEDT